MVLVALVKLVHPYLIHIYIYKESPPGAASWLELVQLFQTSDISPELISCANGLRF